MLRRAIVNLTARLLREGGPSRRCPRSADCSARRRPRHPRAGTFQHAVLPRPDGRRVVRTLTLGVPAPVQARLTRVIGRPGAIGFTEHPATAEHPPSAPRIPRALRSPRQSVAPTTPTLGRVDLVPLLGDVSVPDHVAGVIGVAQDVPWCRGLLDRLEGWQHPTALRVRPISSGLPC
jgi:hypothetical protein